MKKGMMEVAKELVSDMVQCGVISKTQAIKYTEIIHKKKYGEKSVYKATKKKGKPSTLLNMLRTAGVINPLDMKPKK